MPKKTVLIAKGKTYDNKEYLKEIGFKWDPGNRDWYKLVDEFDKNGEETHAIDNLVDQLAEECPEVTIQVQV